MQSGRSTLLLLIKCWDILTSRLTSAGSRKDTLQSFETNEKSTMKVFKFGGASLANVAAIRNTVSIIKAHGTENLIVVLSAMGKTTDALERIVALGQAAKDFANELKELENYHLKIVTDLFP